LIGFAVSFNVAALVGRMTSPGTETIVMPSSNSPPGGAGPAGSPTSGGTVGIAVGGVVGGIVVGVVVGGVVVVDVGVGGVDVDVGVGVAVGVVAEVVVGGGVSAAEVLLVDVADTPERPVGNGSVVRVPDDAHAGTATTTAAAIANRRQNGFHPRPVATAFTVVPIGSADAATAVSQ